MRRPFLATAIVAMLSSGITRAGSYSESINGDLSDIPASPTAWTLSSGANALTGAAGTSGQTVDYDLVAFTIPVGLQLTSVSVDAFHVVSGQSFFGLQAGTPWLDGLGYSMGGDHLIGYTLLHNGSVVPNLLTAFQEFNLPDPPLFSVPMQSGVYILEIQDVDKPFEYGLTFNVSAVGGTPIPGDFNGSGKVDAADLTNWRGDFGLNANSNADGDSDSDGDDYLIWQRNLTVGPATAVPEPSACMLLFLFLPRLRRRR